MSMYWKVTTLQPKILITKKRNVVSNFSVIFQERFNFGWTQQSISRNVLVERIKYYLNKIVSVNFPYSLFY